MNRQVKQIAGLSVFAAACMALGMGASRHWVVQAQQEKPVVVQPRDLGSLPPIADVVDKLNPTVVSITNKSIVKARSRQNPFGDNMFDFFFGPQNPGRRGQQDQDEEMRDTSFGSGVIVSADGEILTNRHVIENPRGGTVDKLEVKLADGRTFEAKVLGKDDQIDIALVKINATHLPYASLGDSDKTRVGEWVVAIGNPLGLEHTVTQGIISAKGRSAAAVGAGSAVERYLQTDAAINRGNSGGPLLNLRGEILGINTAINPMGQNIGFAVPSNMIRNILADLRVGRKVSRGYIGVTLEDLDAGFQEALGVKEGVVVSDVLKGKPGDKAGLRKLDVITKVDGRKVNSREEIITVISSHRAGETVDLELVREGKTKTLSVMLADRSKNTESEEKDDDAPATPEKSEGKVDLKKTYGFDVEAMTPAMRRQFNLPDDVEGVVVSEVVLRSEAYEKIREGMVISAVGGKPVNSLKAFREAVKKAEGKTLILEIAMMARNERVTRMVSIPPRKS